MTIKKISNVQPESFKFSQENLLEAEKNIEISLLEEALNNAKGVVYSNEHYHTPIDSAEKDYVYVSRLRKDLEKDNVFNLWVVSDNLLKGAALNTVQIAELLIKKIKS
mgnify:CR=1 FL=1